MTFWNSALARCFSTSAGLNHFRFTFSKIARRLSPQAKLKMVWHKSNQLWLVTILMITMVSFSFLQSWAENPTISARIDPLNKFHIQWIGKHGFVDYLEESEDFLIWKKVQGSERISIGSSIISFKIDPDSDRRMFYRLIRRSNTGVSISEFMAVNDVTIPDPTGFRMSSDWLEIFNAGSDPVSLKGWYLTDRSSDLTRWEIPDITIGSSQFLVIMASGKSQRDPNKGLLSTNFKLKRSGGYLALVAPDGIRIVSEYGAGTLGYPIQFEDISYGMPFAGGPSGGLNKEFIAYWMMDDSIGNIKDYAAGGSGSHDIKIVSGLKYNQTGLANDGGTAINFSDSSSTPIISNYKDFGVKNNDQFTAEGFFKITETEAGKGMNYIMGSRRSGTGWAIMILNGGQLGFVFDGTGGLAGTNFYGKTKVDDGQAHHFALIFERNGGTLPNTGLAILYIDGEIDFVMDNIPHNHMDSDDGFYIGRRHNSPFGGILDNLRFTNYALKPDEFLNRLIQFEGGKDKTVMPDGLAGHFSKPTPGSANPRTSKNIGPSISEINHFSNYEQENYNIRITAKVIGRYAPVSKVTLTYRIMFENYQPTLLMADDGVGPDDIAGDGIYTANIESENSKPRPFAQGDMVRWYVQATDVNDNTSRKPEFLNHSSSAQYLGTVINDPTIHQTQLPVFQWFVPNPKWYRRGSSNNREWSQGAVFFQGEFIDNLRIRTRGATVANAIKPNFKFDFNNGDHFEVRNDLERVEEMNLNGFHGENVWTPSFLRSVLTYRILRESGVSAPYSFHVHVIQNGFFYGLCAMEEQIDKRFLKRNGLAQEGSLYKAHRTGNWLARIPEGGWRKIFPENEDFSNLAGFVQGISPSNSVVEREKFIFDNVNIPAVINYLAAYSIAANHDRLQHNYYMHMDPNSGEWTIIPWDVDRAFPEGGTLSHQSVKSIYYGDSSHVRISGTADSYNRLYDVVFDVPRTRQMYLRRLRTLVDLWHGNRSARLLGVVDELSLSVSATAAMDEAKWRHNRLKQASFAIKNTINTRRRQLEKERDIPFMQTVVYKDETVVEKGGAANYHVAIDSRLGTVWKELDFSDSGWKPTRLGIGFDNSSNPSTWYKHHLGLDTKTESSIKESMLTAKNASVYIRIPFPTSRSEEIGRVVLNLRFDDGFVAWINGVKVLSQNAPDPVQWNSSATDSASEKHARGSGVDFDITDHRDAIKNGINVLAIQLMNDRPASSDMLCLPTLVVKRPVDQGNKIDFGNIDSNPSSGNQDEEYIELINLTTDSIDISGWELSGGVSHIFKPGTIILGKKNGSPRKNHSLYVSPNVGVFRERINGPSGGRGLFVQGDYKGNISRTGEVISLLNQEGKTVATVKTLRQ